MEIMRIRIPWKGIESSLLCFWRELVDLGHQRFRIEETEEQGGFYVDLLLPEMLKYGIPENDIRLIQNSFLWPWPGRESLLRPVWKSKSPRSGLAMFLDVNYYGIYYDSRRSMFRPCLPKVVSNINLNYRERLRHSAILRKLGMPWELFKDNQSVWPTIDPINPEGIYEYRFQEASEI
jgi:hypothetical protein